MLKKGHPVRYVDILPTVHVSHTAKAVCTSIESFPLQEVLFHFMQVPSNISYDRLQVTQLVVLARAGRSFTKRLLANLSENIV